MSRDPGPIQQYEITWTSGHVETIHAHQVTYPAAAEAFAPLGGGAFGVATKDAQIRFHGEIDGHWRLVLSARQEDIRTVRLVTGGEEIPGATP